MEAVATADGARRLRSRRRGAQGRDLHQPYGNARGTGRDAYTAP